MKKFIAMIMVLLMAISFCAIAEQAVENTNNTDANDEYIGETVTINCEDYSFSISIISIEDIEGLDMCEIKADVRNLSDKPVDYARICFQVIDKDGDLLGNDYAEISFTPNKLKSGRKMECENNISDVKADEIYALEFTTCDVLKDNTDGSRSYVARANLFYDDILINVK